MSHPVDLKRGEIMDHECVGRRRLPPLFFDHGQLGRAIKKECHENSP
jgi:hypothetical protein